MGPWRIRGAPTWRLCGDATTRRSAGLPTPLAILDQPAWRANAADLARRASGTPIRLATKSLRVRSIISEILTMPGFHGLMAFSLREALYLAATATSEDILVAYPTTDRAALAELAGRPGRRRGDHRDGRLHRAPGPDRGSDRTCPGAGARGHRRRRVMASAGLSAVAPGRATLPRPHARAGRDAGPRDHAATRLPARRPDGLRGPDRRCRRPAARRARRPARCRRARDADAALPGSWPTGAPRSWRLCGRSPTCGS